MKLVGRERIQILYERHADAKQHALALVAEIESAQWQSFQDIKNRFPRVSRIGAHYVFDLRGNRYRVDVKIAFKTQVAIIVRAGTHAEYDRWSFD